MVENMKITENKIQEIQSVLFDSLEKYTSELQYKES